MYEVYQSNRFRKSHKKIIRSGSFDVETFDRVLRLLVNLERLPSIYHDHILQGNLYGNRVCHIQGDCVLLYSIDDINKLICLIDIGNHANVLGM